MQLECTFLTEIHACLAAGLVTQQCEQPTYVPTQFGKGDTCGGLQAAARSHLSRFESIFWGDTSSRHTPLRQRLPRLPRDRSATPIVHSLADYTPHHLVNNTCKTSHMMPIPLPSPLLQHQSAQGVNLRTHGISSDASPGPCHVNSYRPWKCFLKIAPVGCDLQKKTCHPLGVGAGVIGAYNVRKKLLIAGAGVTPLGP